MKGERNLSFSRVWLEAWFASFQLPRPEFEFKFDPSRRWRLDAAYPESHLRVGVEIQGGGWKRGAHHRAAGFVRDREKINAAQVAGWVILEFTPQQFMTGEASTVIRQALIARAKEIHERNRNPSTAASEV